MLPVLVLSVLRVTRGVFHRPPAVDNGHIGEMIIPIRPAPLPAECLG